ncbi:bcl2-associated agonist of cell death [Grus americana]|uniref:bcl2-associated agonist of cell death n=1 Tax=Grus americana TaxID=9117 RepID=UPI002407E165|nr:bcl2-associated agonist of cell death [Grus americana]
MFSLDEFPEEPGASPTAPWGGSPPPSQPDTPPAEARGRLGAEAGGGPGDPAGFRGRSRSAPPVLWAARRYGRQLRRMSDEFQLQVLPRPKSLGGAPPGRGGGWRETLRAWWGARRPRPAPPAPPP